MPVGGGGGWDPRVPPSILIPAHVSMYVCMYPGKKDHANTLLAWVLEGITWISTDTVGCWVSTHGRLNITREFSLHGRLPGIKIPYACIEAATVTLWNAVHGHLALTREWVLAWDTTVYVKYWPFYVQSCPSTWVQAVQKLMRMTFWYWSKLVMGDTLGRWSLVAEGSNAQRIKALLS